MTTLLWALPMGGVAVDSPGPETEVRLVRTPENGLQPQAVADAGGTLHLIYLKGDPAACDVFYTVRQPGKDRFAKPLQVNSRRGSAVALGTIRGAQLALGRNGRLHVVWNGSARVTPKTASSAPMLYTRLNEAGDAFEPERNLMTATTGLDGGGSVAADGSGNVFVIWHGLAVGTAAGEANRAVFMAQSTNEGKTFLPEQRISPIASGACACCGLKAFVDARGRVGVLYRAATDGSERDVTLLMSSDRGGSFTNLVVGPWHAMTCPMSSMTLSQGFGDTWLAAWETGRQIQVGAVAPSSWSYKVTQPAGQGSRKHPVVVAGMEGRGSRQLIAWVEGSSWGKDGALAWELVDLETAKKTFGRVEGVPAWSRITAVANKNGGFTIIY